MPDKKKKVKKMVGSGPWASALAEAFGEDPSLSYKITLIVTPHDVVKVTIEKYVDENSMDIIDVISKVVWVEDVEEEEAQ